MPRFAANLSMLFAERPLIERFAAAAAAGFAAVEVQVPYEVPASAVRAELGRTRLAMLGLNTARGQPGERILLDSASSVKDATWPNGCHICEVEIDPETGAVDVVSYASVNDVGRVVNPLIVTGQLDGGATQGIGQALHERFVYDDSGQALTASFTDYAVPRARDVCNFETRMDESVPCRNNALGVKGVGELGTIGATPAVVNAVLDALARAGVGDEMMALQMPLTSEKLWRALQSKH